MNTKTTNTKSGSDAAGMTPIEEKADRDRDEVREVLFLQELARAFPDDETEGPER